MNRWLHLGCGDHKLPAPWENYDHKVDLREALCTRILVALTVATLSEGLELAQAETTIVEVVKHSTE